MLAETTSFLRDRASTEDAIAATTSSGPAAWSHAHLARLYRERCIGSANAAECAECTMDAECLMIRPNL